MIQRSPLKAYIKYRTLFYLVVLKLSEIKPLCKKHSNNLRTFESVTMALVQPRFCIYKVDLILKKTLDCFHGFSLRIFSNMYTFKQYLIDTKLFKDESFAKLV